MNDLLKDYLENFWGYGNENANYWFIGLEEGDLTEGKEFDIRMSNWENTDHPHLMDVKESHRNLAGRKFYFPDHSGKVAFQSTLTRTIYLYFILSGKYTKEEALFNDAQFLSDVKRYQAENFGRSNEGSDTLLMELYPLPCHKVKTWVYGQKYPEINWLSSKRIYKKHIEEIRIPRIFDFIQSQEPKFVCIYCKKKETENLIINNYSRITNNELKPSQIGKQEILYNKHENTVFLFMKHLVLTAGVSDFDLFSIGEEMKKLLS